MPFFRKRFPAKSSRLTQFARAEEIANPLDPKDAKKMTLKQRKALYIARAERILIKSKQRDQPLSLRAFVPGTQEKFAKEKLEKIIKQRRADAKLKLKERKTRGK